MNDDLERALERMEECFSEPDEDSTAQVLFRDDQTRDLVDADGNPMEPDPDAEALIVIDEAVVMGRERAEKEGREILGPVEDAPDGVVKVAWEEGA